MFKAFQPEEKEKPLPYYDDVKSADGWEGHTTSKSIERLIQEIQNNITLLGYVFVSCQRGKFGDRLGFQIHFAVPMSGHGMNPGRIDIACLPLKAKRLRRREKDYRIEGTQKMALYMTAKAIKGMYFLSVLSPAFIPFFSEMLADREGKNTIGQMWQASGKMSNLLPSNTESWVLGEVVKE